jgi:YrbI family 3-deoxy-D-manno-octulosonate 8-phosphate phosphatase
VAIVTRETSDSVAARARKLGVDEVFMGATDKLQVVSALAQRHGLTLSEVAYIGDDVHDVDVMRRVGIAACPRDAEAQAQAVATYRCTRDGGAGCVRELAEHIIAQGRR